MYLADVPAFPDGGRHHGVEVGHQGQREEVLKDAEGEAVVVERLSHICKATASI